MIIMIYLMQKELLLIQLSQISSLPIQMFSNKKWINSISNINILVLGNMIRMINMMLLSIGPINILTILNGIIRLFKANILLLIKMLTLDQIIIIRENLINSLLAYLYNANAKNMIIRPLNNKHNLKKT